MITQDEKDLWLKRLRDPAEHKCIGTYRSAERNANGLATAISHCAMGIFYDIRGVYDQTVPSKVMAERAAQAFNDLNSQGAIHSIVQLSDQNETFGPVSDWIEANVYVEGQKLPEDLK
jgi:hypothetical protein